MSPTEQIPETSSQSFRWKMVALLGLIGLVAVGYWQFGDQLSLSQLAEREEQLQTYRDAYPLLVLGVAFAIYVLVTGVSLPGATVLTLVIAWSLGFGRALVLVSFASTTGATVAFLLSRYFFRDAMTSRFGSRLNAFDDALEREGAFYLFTLRLIPAVPFFVINAVMGLTKIRPWTFWWVSQLGMLPGTAVYVYAGSRIPSLQKLSEEGINAVFSAEQLTQITLAFVALGLFPLLARYTLKWLGKAPAKQSIKDDSTDENNDVEKATDE